MRASPDWVVELFSASRHTRDSFACGYEALDSYIRRVVALDLALAAATRNKDQRHAPFYILAGIARMHPLSFFTFFQIAIL